MDARLLLLGLTLTLARASVAVAQDKFPVQRKAFEAGMKRPPLGKRIGTIERLARTRDPRALAILLKRYAKPMLPKQEERYVIAAAIGRYFRDGKFAGDLGKALRRNAKTEDAWLWFQANRARPEIREPKDPFLRAARRLGVFSIPQESDLRLIPALLDGEQIGMLMPEVCAEALVNQRTRIRTPEFRVAAESLLKLLHGDAPTSARTRLVIARHFAWLFDAPRVTTRAQYWRQLFSFEAIKVLKGPTAEGRPRFFGVEATGDRIVFLIDLSDSMLEPLTPAERLDAQRVRQGSEAQDGAIDWRKIKTRFDLARLFLARYLRALPPGKRFMVIGFGSRARALGATKNLVKASRGAVHAAIRELARMRASSKTKLHPHGQLRGSTNVHGAFLLAYRATRGKPLKVPAYVRAGGLANGCDTVFLLSDGKPTTDNFAANDRHRGGRVTVNSETGETKETTGGGTASFSGPFRRTRHLLDDVQRMNLLRHAEIHTVAMGGADVSLMRGLAERGLGRYRAIGLRANGGRIARWWAVRGLPAGKPEKWGEVGKPEAVLKERFSRAAVYEVGDDWIGWKSVRGGGKYSVVDLGSTKDRCAYAYSVIVPDEAGDVDLRVGAREGVRVWLNGKLVLDELAPNKKFRRDTHKVAVRLKPGPNSLLIKVCSREGRLLFNARFTTPDGKALSFRND